MTLAVRLPRNKLLIDATTLSEVTTHTFPYYRSAKLRPLLVRGGTSSTLVMKGYFRKRLIRYKKSMLHEAFDNRKDTIRKLCGTITVLVCVPIPTPYLT